LILWYYYLLRFSSDWISSFKSHYFFVLFLVIFSPYLKITVSGLCVEICNASSESATVTWSPANKGVLMSLFLAILIPFISSSFHSVIIWFMNMLKSVKWDSLVELLSFFVYFCAVSNGLGIFLSFKMLNGRDLHTSSKPFS
jgi:hypothetical protein